MKNLFELRRSSKVRQKPDKEKQKEYFRKKGKKKAKKEHEKALKHKRKICRVVPSIVASNFDRFMELTVPAFVYDIDKESLKVKRDLISKD